MIEACKDLYKSLAHLSDDEALAALNELVHNYPVEKLVSALLAHGLLVEGDDPAIVAIEIAISRNDAFLEMVECWDAGRQAVCQELGIPYE